jgi:hypothetical protein
MDISQSLFYRYAPHRPRKAYPLLPCLGCIVALAGPFGSYGGIDLWLRIGHFATCFTLIGMLVIEGSYLVARQLFSGRWPVWAALLFDMILLAPTTGLVFISMLVFAPGALKFVGYPDLLWQNALLLLSFRAAAIASAAVRDAALKQAAPAPLARPNASPLTDKLPFELKRARLLALSSEDHYLRVYTDRGEALIHMTLAEAVSLLPRGCQIHRSHWVADGSVNRVRRDRIDLAGGLTLPVSRHRLKQFEAWLGSQSSMPDIGKTQSEPGGA